MPSCGVHGAVVTSPARDGLLAEVKSALPAARARVGAVLDLRYGSCTEMGGRRLSRALRAFASSSARRLTLVTARSLKILSLSLLLMSLVGAALGTLFGWFSTIRWFDNLEHAVASFALGLGLAAQARDSIFGEPFKPSLWRWLMVAGAVLGIGALWEVAEWLYDQIMATRLSKGMTDTVTDLVMDCAGALVGSALGLRHAPGAAQAPAEAEQASGVTRRSFSSRARRSEVPNLDTSRAGDEPTRPRRAGDGYPASSSRPKLT